LEAYSGLILHGSIAYFYIGEEEIGSFRNGQIEELKVLGRNLPVAIEIKGKPFAPVVDVQNTVRQLIDWKSKEVAFENTCDAFGKGLTENIPYAYVGKRYDASSGLVYFGKRCYDPSLGKWLTPDPLGAVDHSNLYQYVLNNPFRYMDKDGRFVITIPLVWGAITLAEFAFAVGAPIAVAAVTWAGYELVNQLNNVDWQNIKSPSYSCVPIYSYASPYSYAGNAFMSKNGSIDETLPKDPDDLLKRPGWKETTHPEAGKQGHRTFENENSGEKLRHDKGKPGAPGHEGESHWHRHNPDRTSRHDEYLDANNNPTPRNSEESHLYPS
jgi:RHS repeat-associated protein